MPEASAAVGRRPHCCESPALKTVVGTTVPSDRRRTNEEPFTPLTTRLKRTAGATAAEAWIVGGRPLGESELHLVPLVATGADRSTKDRNEIPGGDLVEGAEAGAGTRPDVQHIGPDPC